MAHVGQRLRKAKGWLVPITSGIAGVGLGVGAMAVWGGDDAAAAPSAAAATTQTVTASLQTLESSVSASGTLSAVTSDTLSFDASGTVTTVNVTAGDTVAAGDVLASIDTLQLTATLTSAQAALASAKATLADLKDAADGSDESDAKIAAAQAAVDVKQTAVDTAQANMADANLVAPIAGLVTEQPYEVGDVVSGGTSGASGGGGAPTGSSSSSSSSTGIVIQGQDAWTVSVSLSEADVALISLGDQVTFTGDDIDTFYGIVQDISALPSTSSGTATYPVTLQVTGTPTGLFDGVSVDASITYLRRVDVLSVPSNAVTTTDDVSTVTVVADDGSTEQREVTLGDTIGGYTEIVSGLAEGESVQLIVSTSTGNDGQGGFQFPSDGQFPDGFQFPSDGQFPGGQLPGGGQFPGQQNGQNS